MSFEDLELHGHSYNVSLDVTEVVPGRVQQLIKDFVGHWDAFMVYGINKP